jgi:hypothetical protein
MLIPSTLVVRWWVTGIGAPGSARKRGVAAVVVIACTPPVKLTGG